MKLRTPLCDLLGIEVPIIQAGMGWDKEGMTTPPELVAAVSNAGGLGCIGGSSIRPGGDPRTYSTGQGAYRSTVWRGYHLAEDGRCQSARSGRGEKRDPGEVPEACRVHDRIDSETRFNAATAGQEKLGQNTEGNPRTAAGDSRRRKCRF